MSDQRHERYEEQEVYQASGDMEGEESARPHNQQNDK